MESSEITDVLLMLKIRCFLKDLYEFKQLGDDKEQDAVEECELPLIDLSKLQNGNKKDFSNCTAAIAKASSEWGFFQVLNHGISHELLGEMKEEQKKLFKLPFEKKVTSKLLNDSYRWGTPSATSLNQFSWSEAFHFPLSDISLKNHPATSSSHFLREVMERVVGAMSELARTLAGVLVENLGYPGDGFTENCNKNTCFLRLNRYPRCPFSPQIFGLQPHTDSDFLTILYQDEVGGLQLMKDDRWVAVKPNSDALIVNIGDLFQAWSNDIYKSVEHKVMANGKMERYSMAFFLCPSYDSTIGSCKQPSLYNNFTFGDFRKQVQQDVLRTGRKIGLSRFLIT
ncbi:putative gibberellin 2-beta-dioxygenase [Dioscorea sansibarensis]